MPLLTISQPNTNVWMQGDFTNQTPNDAAIVIGPNAHNTRLFVTNQIVNSSALGDADQSVGIRIDGAARVSIIGLGGNISGFKYGVSSSVPCWATSIQGLSIFGCSASGITHTGDGLTVRGCTVEDIGGVSCFGPEFFYGIRSLGKRPTITGNIVRNITAPVWEAVGISSDSRGENGIISCNQVVNAVKSTVITPHNLPSSWGIWIGDDALVEEDVSVTHNLLRNWQVGFAFSGETKGLLGTTNALLGYDEASILTPENWKPGWPGIS